MTIRGLFETHLTVADLPRSVAFYRDLVGLPVALELPERGAAFHWIGRPGQAMLGLWTMGSAPMGMRLHVAFDVAVADVLAAPERLRARGIEPLSFFGAPTGEPSVIGWMPAAAVYFRDPDGHQLEYLAMLEGPARPDLGIVGWSQFDATPSAPPVQIEQHTGARADLRSLFALAEDSGSQLDSYLDCGRVLVAVQGDRVLGHLQLTETQSSSAVEIKNMAVLPAHRRRGIGRMLVAAAIQAAREDSRGTVQVATAAADLDSLRFYQQLGFRMRSVERDAFTPATGYEIATTFDGIELRDRVWLDVRVRTDP
jgi:GNAT superfamily N-acetyltransferase/catechol 2,3-dioxygenase-like lactoylglutathione lyase family enzyme